MVLVACILYRAGYPAFVTSTLTTLGLQYRHMLLFINIVFILNYFSSRIIKLKHNQGRDNDLVSPNTIHIVTHES